MKNSDIKYKTSCDYEKLYDLVKEGKIIIGFTSILSSKDYSRIATFSYSKINNCFEFGNTYISDDFNKDRIVKLCEQNNVQYIPLN